MGILRVLRSDRRSQSGNVFFALFGAVALVGVVGASSMQIMKGPVRSMSEVTKRTVAENNMIASAKLALIAATSGATGGDCDADGFVEPVPFDAAGVGAAPTGGGYLPASIGAALNDPWDTRYGYCVWDHGAVTTGCTGLNYLAGINAATGYSIAIISAGPDRQFATTCAAYPTATALNKTPGTDDIVLGYTYGEASALSGGLWNLKDGDADTAQIARNLEVKDSGGSTTFALDADTGIGDFLGVLTNTIGGKASPLDITGGLKFEDTGIAIAGACTQADAFAFDGTADQLVRCNGANWVPAGGSDNLGNHIATQNIQLGSRWLTGDAVGNDGIQINAAGAVTTSGTLGVGTNATVAGTLGVTGATALSTLGTSGLATLNSASVTGNASVGGTLGVTGATTLSTLTATSASAIRGVLTLGTTGTSGSVVFNRTADGAAVGYIQRDAVAGMHIGSSEGGGHIVFETNGGGNGTGGAPERMRLDIDGDLGIGVTNPTSKLHVAGQVDVSGNKIINLLDPIAAQDAASKAYVDARVASGTGFTEADPQVGILQATKWCVGSADGSAINCDQNAPSGAGDNLGNHVATQNVKFFSATGSAGSLPSGAGDNLGNHTATGTLYMAGNPLWDASSLYLRDTNGNDGKWGGINTADNVMNFQRRTLSTGALEATVANLNLMTGTLTASAFVGDGSGLTGVSSSLPSLASANMWVGNGSNVATAVTMSGDATMANTGAVTLTADSVTTAEITNASIALADLSATGTKSSATFLRGDNTWATPTSGSHGLDTFTSTGSWTVPAGVTWAKATLIGGGGGGAKNGGGSGIAGGGGAGAFVIKWIAVTPGAVMTVTVGAAGTAGAAGGGAGGNGGDTVFGGVTAQNGTGGTNSVTAGTGGTASGGDYNRSGGNGAFGGGGAAAQWRPEHTYGEGGDGANNVGTATAGKKGFAVIEW